jgi:hypothetical protein
MSELFLGCEIKFEDEDEDEDEEDWVAETKVPFFGFYVFFRLLDAP